MTEQSPNTPPAPAQKTHLGMIGLCLLVTFACIAVLGIASRAQERRDLQEKTHETSLQSVGTITVQKMSDQQDLVLPGTVQAWHEAVIYARTSGYIKEWNVDIGAHVTKDQILAVIDAPDLDAQFHQAQADLNTAIANNTIAQLTAKRYATLLKNDSVSSQQTDQAAATAAATAAAVESAKAKLDQLQQQENFKQIAAPFDGTITQRAAQVGTLINGGNGSTSTGQELFHIADTSRLRVYVEVPENNANLIKPDLTAEVRFPVQPRVTTHATLDHSAQAIDPITRTLQTEFQIDNRDGGLLTGGFADVHIQLPAGLEMLTLPVNALLFRDGMQVAVVGADHHVALKNITIGRDYGKYVEILSGVSPGDTVVINPPDSVQNGQEVVPLPQDKAKN